MKNKLLLILVVLVPILTLIYIASLNLIFLPLDILTSLPIFGNNSVHIQNSLLADPIFQFEPWRIFIKSSIEQGSLPFWNDLNGNGVPFLANPITSVFSPLNIFYFIFSPKVSLAVIAFFKVLLFVFGVYLYLRQVKIAKKMSIIGGLVALSGYFLLWLNWPQANVYILFPFVLLMIEKSHNKLTFFKFTVLSFIFFIAFLSGHPETYFQIALVGLLYILFRYTKNWRLLLYYCVGVIIGTLLASFQLIPFLEYLHYSWALEARSITPHGGLPLKSFILNFFPYIYGAPHLKFYKPFSGTNFQEAAGGYVGLIFIFLIVLKRRLIFKEPLLRAWFLISIISLSLTYSIPVVSDIIKLTPLGLNDNSRMVGTLGFSVVMMGIIILNNIKVSKFIRNINIRWHYLTLLILFGLAITIVGNNFTNIFASNFSQKQLEFLPMIVTLLSISTITSIGFFLIIQLQGKISKYFYLSALIILIAIQSLFLFVSYNPFVKKDFYYPRSEAIKILQKSKLPIINVGSINLAPDINMAYGIKSIENYDAMDILWYKKAFDLNFPDKNRWGNIDSVTLSSLKKFGVGNVISDYDINLEKVSYSRGSDIALPLQNKIEVPIIGNGKVLRQIRFIPATYNRENKCEAFVSLGKGTEILEKVGLSCSKFYNGMFYTISLNPQLLQMGGHYQISIETQGTSSTNYIGLFGNKNMPYLDILFDSGNSYFKNIYKKDTVSIYSVPDSKIIDTTAKIKVLKDTGNKLILSSYSPTPTSVIVKKTYYPGWQLKVNEVNTIIAGRDPFMKFTIPEGKSYIELEYVPISFYFGLLISGITLFIMFSSVIIVTLRNSNNLRVINKFFGYLSRRAGVLSVSYHLYLFTLAFLISVFAFVLITNIIPIKFNMPQTTAINWLTVHQYPKQMDLFFFAVGFPAIILFSILIWVIVICRKK